MLARDRLSPGKYALRVEDYLRLCDADAFDDRRTELIGGDVLVMAPEYRPHAFVRDELTYRLRRILETIGSTLYPTGGSVFISDNDMPQPDIVLTREPRGPGAIPSASVALIVEISLTTLAIDMGRKREAYAAAGIAEYWVVEVESRIIHLMSSPAGSTFRHHRRVAIGQPLAAATIPGLTVSTNGL